MAAVLLTYPLARECKSNDKATCGKCRPHRHSRPKAAGLVKAVERFHQIDRECVDDKGGAHHENKPPAEQTCTLARVVGHYAGKRAIRNVVSCVDDHQEGTSDSSPNHFSALT